MEEKKLSRFTSKESIQKRLKLIEGQIKGIQNMVEDERYCVDILTQIAAVRSAIDKVGSIILENHIKGCVTDEITNPNADSEVVIEELMDIIRRFSK